jgi:hypothetical protein
VEAPLRPREDSLDLPQHLDQARWAMDRQPAEGLERCEAGEVAHTEG